MVTKEVAKAKIKLGDTEFNIEKTIKGDYLIDGFKSFEEYAETLYYKSYSGNDSCYWFIFATQCEFLEVKADRILFNNLEKDWVIMESPFGQLRCFLEVDKSVWYFASDLKIPELEERNIEFFNADLFGEMILIKAHEGCKECKEELINGVIHCLKRRADNIFFERLLSL